MKLRNNTTNHTRGETAPSCREILTLLSAFLMVLVMMAAPAWATEEAPEAPKPETEKETELPAAEELLDKLVEALGGLEAASKIHNRVDHGTVTLNPLGLAGTFTTYAAEPNLSYAAIEIPSLGLLEEGTGNGVAWERSVIAGTRVKEGPEKEMTLRLATFNAPLYWRKLYEKVECVGVDTVEGKSCYKVELTAAPGEVETWYLDQESGLLIKLALTMRTAMGDIPAESIIRDYREVDGLMVPFELIEKALILEIQLNLVSSEQNVEIPEGTFDIPAEVQALMGKQAEGSAAPEPEKDQ